MICPDCQTAIKAGSAICYNCGKTFPVEDPLIGTTLLNQFKILEKIDTGGMGAIYLADQVNINRKVAVKVLHPHFCQNAVKILRFQREAKAASALDHPNIIQIHLFDQLPNGAFFIVMEYIAGKNLGQLLLQEKKLKMERALNISLQISSALKEAHLKGIIHRDLKPENIMIAQDSEGHDYIKILDFGIVKYSDEVKITKDGAIFGTPQYMSPEQSMGEELDGRADIYSLSVIIYEMLTGELPIKGESTVELFVKHQIQNPVPPRALNPNISEELQDLLLKGLAKKKTERQATIHEFYDQLLQVFKKLKAVTLPPLLELEPKTTKESAPTLLTPTESSAVIDTQACQVEKAPGPEDTAGHIQVITLAPANKKEKGEAPKSATETASTETLVDKDAATEVPIESAKTELPRGLTDIVIPPLDLKPAVDKKKRVCEKAVESVSPVEKKQESSAAKEEKAKELNLAKTLNDLSQKLPPRELVAVRSYAFLGLGLLFILFMVGGLSFIIYKAFQKSPAIIDNKGVFSNLKKPMPAKDSELLEDDSQETSSGQKSAHSKAGLINPLLKTIKNEGAGKTALNLDRIYKLIEKENWQEAISETETLIKKNPDQPELLFLKNKASLEKANHKIFLQFSEQLALKDLDTAYDRFNKIEVKSLYLSRSKKLFKKALADLDFDKQLIYIQKHLIKGYALFEQMKKEKQVQYYYQILTRVDRILYLTLLDTEKHLKLHKRTLSLKTKTTRLFVKYVMERQKQNQ